MIDPITGIEKVANDDNKEAGKSKEETPGKQSPTSGGPTGEEDEGEESEGGEGGNRLEEEEEEEVDSETLALAKLLVNPETRSAVIAALAKDSGIKERIADGETPKQVVRSIKDDLKKQLGPEWEFLAEKLAPMFDGLLNYTSQMESRLTAQISKSIEETSTAAAEKFFDRNPTAKPFEQGMMKLMNDFPPPKETAKLQEYLGRLFTLAKEDQGTRGVSGKKISQKIEERINRNSGATNLKGGEKEGQEAPKVYRTPREATLAALEMIQNQGKKK